MQRKVAKTPAPVPRPAGAILRVTKRPEARGGLDHPRSRRDREASTAPCGILLVQLAGNAVESPRLSVFSVSLRRPCGNALSTSALPLFRRPAGSCQDDACNPVSARVDSSTLAPDAIKPPKCAGI